LLEIVTGFPSSRGWTVEAVQVAGGIGEPAVKVTLLEVKNALLTIRHVFGEEIVEVVGLQGQEDASTISQARGEDQISQESTETTGFARRRCLG